MVDGRHSVLLGALKAVLLAYVKRYLISNLSLLQDLFLDDFAEFAF